MVGASGLDRDVTILADKTVAARKDHTCTLCGYLITKGMVHRSYSVAEDGSVQRLREHPACYNDAALTCYPGDDWAVSDEHRSALDALANLSDALDDAPPLPTVLEWVTVGRPDESLQEARWWRYYVRRRGNAAWVHRPDGCLLVASVLRGHVIDPLNAHALRLAERVAEEKTP